MLCAGETISEGDFAPGRVASAALLNVATEKDKKGKTYYVYDVLTRTGADPKGGPFPSILPTCVPHFTGQILKRMSIDYTHGACQAAP